jgi:hypothetical protein
LIAEDVAPGLGTGGLWTRDFAIDAAGEPLVVTLVWTDYPGTQGAGVELVNDLDLVVVRPGGTQYLGNVFSGGFSTTGGTADRRNVEECVRIGNPPTGNWTVRVSGYNVAHGSQPFAVVVNGAFLNWPPGGFSSAGEATPALPRGALITASPNPAAGATTVAYAVPAGHVGRVRVLVVDVAGRVVRGLVDKGQRTGAYRVTWDGLDDLGRAAPAGIYFARLILGSETATAKIVVER